MHSGGRVIGMLIVVTPNVEEDTQIVHSGGRVIGMLIVVTPNVRRRPYGKRRRIHQDFYGAIHVTEHKLHCNADLFSRSQKVTFPCLKMKSVS